MPEVLLAQQGHAVVQVRQIREQPWGGRRQVFLLGSLYVMQSAVCRHMQQRAYMWHLCNNQQGRQAQPIPGKICSMESCLKKAWGKGVLPSRAPTDHVASSLQEIELGH